MSDSTKQQCRAIKQTRCFSMSQDQFERISELAKKNQCSSSEIIRLSFDMFGDHAGDLAKNQRIWGESAFNDISELIFTQSAYPGYGSPKSKLRVYIHKKAFADLKNLGEKIENEMMEFFYSSMVDGSILHKGEIKKSIGGLTFICFRITLLKVYCVFSPMKITILSVSN